MRSLDVDIDGDWLWPEETLTYENALLPHALIVAGVRLEMCACAAWGSMSWTG